MLTTVLSMKTINVPTDMTASTSQRRLDEVSSGRVSSVVNIFLFSSLGAWHRDPCPDSSLDKGTRVLGRMSILRSGIKFEFSLLFWVKTQKKV